jgi:hypothetical protein
MSISTPSTGGSRRPSAKAVAGGKPTTKAAASGKPTTKAAAKSAAAKTTGGTSGKPSSGKPSGGGPGKRPPIAPVKVNRGRNWGPIILFTIVGLVAAGIIGFGVYEVQQNSMTWTQKAAGISGLVNYRKTEPDLLKAAQHAYGKISYPQSPPVGGKHNPNWMRCQGDVYDAQIPNENAVHAMEHGAVWITYNPSLSTADVAKLAAKVKGNDYMLMSPYPGLDKPISLQAWGYQLKLDSASDGRIDQFIKYLRVNASMEPGTPCSSGNYTTKTGSEPVNLGASASASAPASQ